MAIILVCIFIYCIGHAIEKYGLNLQEHDRFRKARRVDCEVVDDDIPFSKANPRLCEAKYGKH